MRGVSGGGGGVSGDPISWTEGGWAWFYPMGSPVSPWGLSPCDRGAGERGENGCQCPGVGGGKKDTCHLLALFSWFGKSGGRGTWAGPGDLELQGGTSPGPARALPHSQSLPADSRNLARGPSRDTGPEQSPLLHTPDSWPRSLHLYALRDGQPILPRSHRHLDLSLCEKALP